jgi:hypothetical protein
MYGFDEKTGEGQVQLMNAGITENVKLTGVEFENSKSDGTGTMVLRFFFKDANAATFTHTEFAIDAERTKQNAITWGKAEEAEEMVEREFQAQGERIKHILSCFLTNDKLVFAKTSSWEGFCNGIKEMLGLAYEGVLVRVKIVYNKKDYLMFPKRAISPFIQAMSVPNGLRINAKYERVEKLAQDNEANAFDLTPKTDASGVSAGEVGAAW